MRQTSGNNSEAQKPSPQRATPKQVHLKKRTSYFPSDEEINNYFGITPQPISELAKVKKVGRPPVTVNIEAVRDNLMCIRYCDLPEELDDIFVGVGRLMQSKKSNTKPTAGSCIFRFFKTYPEISTANIKAFWECSDRYAEGLFPQLRVAHLMLERWFDHVDEMDRENFRYRLAG